MNLILGVVIVGTILTMDDLIATNKVLYFNEGAISQQTGLKENDEILSIDGKRVLSGIDVSFLMTRSDDGIFDMTVRRDGEKVELSDVKFETKKQDGYTLITYDFIILGEETTVFNVVGNAFKQTASIGRLVWLSLFDLVTGKFGLSDLSGPVGIANVIDETIEVAKPYGISRARPVSRIASFAAIVPKVTI